MVGTEDDHFHDLVLILGPPQDLGGDGSGHDLVLAPDLKGMDQIDMIVGCTIGSVSLKKRTHIRGAESVKSLPYQGNWKELLRNIPAPKTYMSAMTWHTNILGYV